MRALSWQLARCSAFAGAIVILGLALTLEKTLAQQGTGSAETGLAAESDLKARKEMEVGRFNVRKGNYIGAANRFKVVVTEYRTSPYVAEALMLLADCFLTGADRSEGEHRDWLLLQARSAAAAVGRYFPDSIWYQGARDLLKLRGLEPEFDANSWITKTFN